MKQENEKTSMILIPTHWKNNMLELPVQCIKLMATPYLLCTGYQWCLICFTDRELNYYLSPSTGQTLYAVSNSGQLPPWQIFLYQHIFFLLHNSSLLLSNIPISNIWVKAIHFETKKGKNKVQVEKYLSQPLMRGFLNLNL